MGDFTIYLALMVLWSGEDKEYRIELTMDMLMDDVLPLPLEVSCSSGRRKRASLFGALILLGFDGAWEELKGICVFNLNHLRF